MAEKADMPSDNISLPPMYAHSETFTESSPPAYRKPGMAAVRIARIVCITVLAMTFIVGFFVVSHKWIQTRECNCDKHEAINTLQRAALLQQAPDLQIQDSNKVEDNKEKTTNEVNKEAENSPNLINEETLQSLEKEEEKQANAFEEAMKERVKELNNNVKLPVDLLLGNPALAGRNVQCKVEKKQQNIADGIISQAIIVTCDDDENSTEDDSENSPNSVLPPGMRRLTPPMSLLGHIMKILASRPRTAEGTPQIIERPLPSFSLKPMDGQQVSFQGPIITPISGSFQAPIMTPMNGQFPGPFAQGQIHIIPIRKMEIQRQEQDDEEDENNNKPLIFSSQSAPPQLQQIPMIREITGLPQRLPMQSSFQPHMIFRNLNDEEQQQSPMILRNLNDEKQQLRPMILRNLNDEEQQPRPMIFRNLNDEEQQPRPMIFRNLNDAEQQPRPMIFRNLNDEEQQPRPMIFRNLNNEEQQTRPMIFRNQNDEEQQQRPELPFPFPFANGQVPIRVVRLPQGANMFRELENNDQREDSNPEEGQQEGNFPFSPIQQLMNLFPARRTRIIRLRPKPSEDASNSEMLPFPVSRGALPLENNPRELPPIHLPPQMTPMEASGRALPAPVALPEVRVMRFPFIPQPQPISEARVITHMEVQQHQDEEQGDENEEPQNNGQFFRQEDEPQQSENMSLRKVNGEFGPPKTHTVLDGSRDSLPLDADVIPFPPQLFRQFRFNPQIPDEAFSPQPQEEFNQQTPEENNFQQPREFNQLPLEFNPQSQREFDHRPQPEFDFQPEPEFNSQPEKDQDSELVHQEPITQPQFQPRFVAPPPPRFAPEGRTSFPTLFNSDAEVIDRSNDGQSQDSSNLHQITLN